MKNNIKKNYIWNTIGALTISLTSLFYTMILSRFSDINSVGIFSFGFSFACMMVTLASFGGRTYQVTDTKDEIKTSTYILTRYITVLVTFILVIIFLLFKNYSTEKNIIIVLLCTFKFFEEISDVYYGIIQKKKKLYKVGIYQFVKSLINLLLFIISILIIKKLIISVILITINNIIFSLFLERNDAKKEKTWKLEIDKKEIIKLLKINLYICLYTFLSAYLVSSPKYAIDTYLTNEIQAIFNMLIMPATLMLLIGGFIINPILVDIAEIYDKKEIKRLKIIIKKVIFLLFVLGLFGIIGTYLLGTNILGIIYGIDFSEYKIQLVIIIIGATIYTLTTILGTIFITMRKIKIQVIIAIICSFFSYFISNVMVNKYGLDGGVYSYLFTMLFRFICYIPLLINLRKEEAHEKN